MDEANKQMTLSLDYSQIESNMKKEKFSAGKSEHHFIPLQQISGLQSLKA